MMRMDRRRFLIGLGATGAFASCGGAPSSVAGSASASPSATAFPHVKLGQVSVSAANAGIWSAEEGGYLKKYGVDAEVVFIADSTQGVAALVSGGVPLNCGLSGTAVVASALSGSDLVFHAVTVNTFPSSLYVQPTITSVAGLKGKIIAVSRFGTASDTGGRLALRQNGLDPSKDATFVSLGGLPEILAGLTARQVDAGVLSPPQTIQARQAGFRELFDMGLLGIEYAYNGVVSTRTFARQNPGLLEAVLKAIIEGAHRFKTDPDFGKAVVAKRGNIKDQAVIDESWQVFAKNYLSEPPFPTDGGMKTVLGELSTSNPKAQGVSPATFYDLTTLTKLVDSGFVRSVIGR